MRDVANGRTAAPAKPTAAALRATGLNKGRAVPLGNA